MHVMIAGSVAGATQVMLGCPVEVVKVRIQTLHRRSSVALPAGNNLPGGHLGPVSRNNAHDVAGRAAVLAFTCSCTSICSIEDRLHWMKLDRQAGASGVGSTYEASVIATAGATAGVISWLFIVPFDVVKTVMQTETDPTVHKSMMHCFRGLVERHGWRSLFRGSSMVIARAAPVNSATFLGYEWCLGKCHQYFTIDST
ncbi:hypothetical protein quinque_012262 [Culex quinquefasciatus]